MSEYFISFSQDGLSFAQTLLEWLREQGYDDVFLDRDAKGGIPLGSEWENYLRRAMRDASTLFVVLTPGWFVSEWCQEEFRTARALGKIIIPLLRVSRTELPMILSHPLGVYQNREITGDEAELFADLKIRLAAISDNNDPRLSLQAYYRGVRYLCDGSFYQLSGTSRQSILDWYVALGSSLPDSDEILPSHDLFSRWTDPDDTCVVEGEAGSGKSTLLRFVARSSFDAPERIGLSGPLIPLLLQARDLVASEGGTYAERIRMAQGRSLSGLTLAAKLPDDFLHAWPAATGASWLFVLDGFDEVEKRKRREIASWICSLLCDTPGARLLVGTRDASLVKSAFEGQARPGIIHMRLNSPDGTQTGLIASRWLGGDSSLFVAELAKGLTGDICHTPLGIGLAASSYRSGSILPATRAEIYDSYTGEVIAEAVDKYFKKRTSLEEGGLRRMLECLAEDEVRSGSPADQDARSASVARSMRMLDTSLSEIASQTRAGDLGDDILLQCGFFSDGLDWNHITFRDYFAACAVKRNLALESDEFLEIVSRPPGDPFWDGVQLFLFSLWSPLAKGGNKSWNEFRSVFERHLGSAEPPSPPQVWWRRILPIRSKTVTTPAAGLATLAPDYARVGQWMIEAGGAPDDLAKNCLHRLITSSETDLRESYLNLCKNVFNDPRPEPRIIRGWASRPGLRTHLGPWQDIWMKDLREGGDTAASSAGLLVEAGAGDRILAAIQAGDLGDKGAISLMQTWLPREVSCKLCETLLDSYIPRAKKALQIASELLENSEPDLSYDRSSPFGIWAIANPDHLFAKYAQILWSEHEPKETALRIIKLVGGGAVERWSQDVARVSVESLRGIDFIFMFRYSMLEKFSEIPSLPASLRDYARWWIDNEAHLPNVMPPMARYFMHLRNSLVSVMTERLAITEILDRACRKLASLGESALILARFRSETSFELLKSLLPEVIESLDRDEIFSVAPQNSAEFECAAREAWFSKNEENLEPEDARLLATLLDEAYAVMIERHPGSHELLMGRADLALKFDRYEDAIDLYSQTIATNKDLARAYSGRSLSMFFCDRLPEALADADAAIATGDDSVRIWRSRGLFCYLLDLDLEAIVTMDHAETWIKQSFPTDHEGEMTSEDARRLVRAELEMPVEMKVVHEVRSKAMFQLGMIGQCLVETDAYLDIEAGDTRGIENKIHCLSALGRHQESRDFAREKGVEEPVIPRAQNLLHLDSSVSVLSFLSGGGGNIRWLDALRLFAMKAEDLPFKDDALRLLHETDLSIGSDSCCFWAAVLLDDETGAREVVATLTAEKKDADLRWLSTDYQGVLANFVSDWVGELAKVAAQNAELIHAEKLAAIVLPAAAPEPAAGSIIEPFPPPAPLRQKRVKPLFPLGMLCSFHAIGGYDEELDLAKSILGFCKGIPSLVIIPLHASGHIYAQSNQKLDIKDDFAFKLCVDYEKARDRGVLKDLISRAGIKQVIITNKEFFHVMKSERKFSEISRMFQHEEHPLPYLAEEVVFE